MALFLAVGLGGFIGAVARYGLSAWASRHAEVFPLGTLAVNLLGCFAIGVLSLYAERTQDLSETTRVFLTAGVLGSLTTFSTFSVETFRLLQAGTFGTAAINVAANVGLGLACVAAGRALTRGLV